MNTANSQPSRPLPLGIAAAWQILNLHRDAIALPSSELRDALDVVLTYVEQHAFYPGDIAR